MMKKYLIKTTFIIAFLSLPFIVSADYQNQTVNFFVDPQYDLFGRDRLSASLIYTTPKIYFYLEDGWWNSLEESKKQETLSYLNSLSQEFRNKIYPTLTSTFGSEWNPGIDNDAHITVLFEQIRKDAGGYFNNGNEYYRAQYPYSNEREMIYLNTENVKDSQLKGYLAHEFQHLISFNQKEKIFGTQEDIWLNEARSEIALTLLGYNSPYEGSNLQRRVRTFLDKPSNSLTEWEGKTYDYGVLNFFGHYLLDYYGQEIFSESLKMRETGIDSLNKFLSQKNYKEDFSEIFTNWTIATLINDCSLGDKYCYKNESLKRLQVVPTTNFLPITGKSSLSVSKLTKNWAGNWEKFIGGSSTLKFEFAGFSVPNFKVPYLITDSSGKISIDFLKFDSSQKSTIYISDFGTKNVSFNIIPSVQIKTENSESGPFYSYAFNVSVVGSEEIPSTENQANIDKLLAQIEVLKKEIARIQALLAEKNQTISCSKFTNNLYFGLRNNSEVSCLQQFLKSKGTTIYPEGLVTGNYFSATVSAVKKYQASKGISQTGYLGPLTRAAVNSELLGSY